MKKKYMLKAASCVLAAALVWTSGSTTAWNIKKSTAYEKNNDTVSETELRSLGEQLIYGKADSGISPAYSVIKESFSDNGRKTAPGVSADPQSVSHGTDSTAAPERQTAQAAVSTEICGESSELISSPVAYSSGLADQIRLNGNSRTIPDPEEADLVLGSDVIDNETFRQVADELGDFDEVFRFVKDNIRNEMYTGSKKGALLTLAQLGGNDLDQAALLVALLRAKDIPARFVSGTVRFTPGQALAFTGAADAETAVDIMAASFRNTHVMKKGNDITGFVFEHTWAEAYVPYTEYRGAGGKGGESIWIPLDPSFKKLSRNENEIKPAYTDEELERFGEMKAMAAEAPEIFTGSYDAPEKLSIYDYAIKNNKEKYLPASLPYEVQEISERYNTVKDADKQTISISIEGETLLDIPVADLYGRYINISYEPATDADAKVIESYEKITEVPAASVNVVPVVTVGDEKFRSKVSCHLGECQTMTTYVNDDTPNTVKLDSTLVSGSVYALNLDLNVISSVEGEYAEGKLKAAAEKESAGGVYPVDVLGAIAGYAGRYYFTLCDAQNQVYAAMENISSSRHLAVAVTGYQFGIRKAGINSEFLDTGHFFIDVAYNCTTSVSLDGDKNKVRQYNLETGMSESNFKDSIWAEITGTDQPCVSTLSVMAAAAENDIAPVYITAKNADSVLAECSIDDYIKEAVKSHADNDELVILIPELITIGDWTGTSYIAMEPETGIASFMLPDGTAGGASPNIDISSADSDISDMLISLNIQLSYMNRAIAMVNAVKNFGAAAEAEEGDLNTSEGAKASLKALKGVIGAAAQYADAVQMELDMCDLILRYVDENMNEKQLQEELIKATRKNIETTIKNLYYTTHSKSKASTLRGLYGQLMSLGDDGNEYVKLYKVMDGFAGLML